MTFLVGTRKSLARPLAKRRAKYVVGSCLRRLFLEETNNSIFECNFDRVAVFHFAFDDLQSQRIEDALLDEALERSGTDCFLRGECQKAAHLLSRAPTITYFIYNTIDKYTKKC